MNRLPILIVIPHGGREIPDELSGLEQIDKFGLFIESDVCAGELFSFPDFTCVKTNISRLFMDMDRQISKPPYPDDWIIKEESISGRQVFKEGVFPDKTAVASLIRRYYAPFHEVIENEISRGKIKFILECHTMMSVGPRFAADSGKPRPLINLENVTGGMYPFNTCPQEQTEYMLSCLKKYFNNEDQTVIEKFSINRPKSTGFLMEKYGRRVNMLKISLSSALYLNDKYFNYETLSVDKKRLLDLREKLLTAIEKFSLKYL